MSETAPASPAASSTPPVSVDSSAPPADLADVLRAEEAARSQAFFRSFLQARTGLVLSSLLFAASHASYGLPLMLVGVFTVSTVLGAVFRATRDALPCMVAHAVFDGVQLFLILPAVIDAVPQVAS